ncbi:MAG: hypothetical protein FJW27_05780 [Acidimicrobiia bacterium]|nr:hypothetical protein [Acidimicrobiia bacterium]
MTARWRTTARTMAVACAVAAGVATVAAQNAPPKPSAGSQKWVLARTPDGKPDFQGVWANNTVTPLERPKQWEGKTTLTDAEVKELQNIARLIDENDGDAQFGDGFIQAVLDKQTKPGSYDPGTGNYNQFWIVGRDWHDRRTSLIQDPPDGKLPPMTPEGKRRMEALAAHRKAHQYEDPENFPNFERCTHFGLPRMQAAYNSYLQIVQTPRQVMIMNEMAHDARVIPVDSRPRNGKDFRPWNGESRARWEGDTLVIETTNFSPKADLMYLYGTAENLQLTERFTRVSRDVLNYEFTMNDPTTWTKPWTAMIPLARKDEMIFEYACHEANVAMPNMLRGHRFQEKQEAAKKTSGN